MAEIELLQSIATYLGASGLSPTPALLGIAEPAKAADLPAVVLSIEACTREGTGIGARQATERKTGVLSRTATIDLAHPVDPVDGYVLLDATRKQLVLPYGGLVKATGSTGTLTGADVSVTLVSGATTHPAIAASSPPPAGQVYVDPVGLLVFGTALPPTGTVTATFNLGSWEREVIRMRGTLRVDVCGNPATQTGALSDQIATRLIDSAARTAIQRLYTLDLNSLSSVAVVPGDLPNASRRSARFSFLWEQLLDTPDSSGRVIRTIPINSQFFPPETP